MSEQQPTAEQLATFNDVEGLGRVGDIKANVLAARTMVSIKDVTTVEAYAIWLYVEEARALRDWLNKALP